MKNLIRFLFVLCFVTNVNAQIPKLFKKKKAPEKVEAPKPKKKDKNAIWAAGVWKLKTKT